VNLALEIVDFISVDVILEYKLLLESSLSVHVTSVYKCIVSRARYK
jgi:hypothetical protein